MTSVNISLDFMTNWSYFKQVIEVVRKLDHKGSNMDIEGYDERERLRSVSIPSVFLSDTGFTLTVHVYHNGYHQAITPEEIEEIANAFKDKFVEFDKHGDDLTFKFEKRNVK